MGNIVGKKFGVVASKDYNTALTESVKEGNQGKFYLAETGGNGFDNITTATDNSRNTLIVNGNKIQGVSTNDINKIDTISSSAISNEITSAIADSGFFKYKGSLNYFSELPSNFNRAKIGDVYNIITNFKLDGVYYPNYTNVVCIGTKEWSDLLKWDALGGSMEIGTHADSRIINQQELEYYSLGASPINSFSLRLSSGLTLDDGNKICLKISTSNQERQPQETDISGLTIVDGGISLALATGYDNTFINGLVIVSTYNAIKGGLSIYGPSIVDYLKNNDDFKTYINSLANNKITIQ